LSDIHETHDHKTEIQKYDYLLILGLINFSSLLVKKCEVKYVFVP